ncbi:MAG: hypothetical protein ABI232_12470 [Jatrophihabitantaceae bacterium]
MGLAGGAVAAVGADDIDGVDRAGDDVAGDEALLLVAEAAAPNVPPAVAEVAEVAQPVTMASRTVRTMQPPRGVGYPLSDMASP